MQFAEGLTDRQAAEAVRARIDWKYPLALPLLRSRLRRFCAQRVPYPLTRLVTINLESPCWSYCSFA